MRELQTARPHAAYRPPEGYFDELFALDDTPHPHTAALAAALRALADDPERARELGAAGRELVAERFGLERMLEELQAAYDDVAARR
jgi:glycosyltransferase involved in cell wall biosynthesis